MQFSGLVAYPVTPFFPGGAIDLVTFAEQIERLADSGVEAICVLGTAGSFAYLDHQERGNVVRTAVAAAKGSGVPVGVGISALTTQRVLELGWDAENAGADGLVVNPLSYVALRSPEIADQVETVASSVSLPLCLDNNPATTGFVYPVDLAAELTRLENVVAFKDTADSARALQNRRHLFDELCDPGTTYGVASAHLIVDDAIASAAWHTGLAAALPREFTAFRTAAVTGDEDAVRRWQEALRPLIEVLRWERPLSSIYALNDVCGVRTSAPRRPLHPVTTQSRQRIEAAVRVVRHAMTD
ncbi:dihydrodipicolinate synthase family protein [Kocuria sp. JC486]|uniref:Dihydrodipicolinate synthase family protein n=2 Tax=Micrococcaceae TaxID=1268 RepID=A0A3N3ZUC1_9MICC|nr:dihydrodipicolinate synthase family protein [Kocuria sp. JC486]ROZ63858.1 dihydrodipicolinate synthase family protein [Kocuria soli]